MEQNKSYSEPSNFHFQLIFSVPIHSAEFVVNKLNYQGKIERWREKRYIRRILPKCRDVRKELWQWRLINPILGRRKLFFANYGDSHVGRPICLPCFFQASLALTTILFCSITIRSTTFSSKADTILFQLRTICLLYSMQFQHFSVILINNWSPCRQTTGKFTKLI